MKFLLQKRLKVVEKYKESNNKFINIVSKLDSLSPLKTLSRGYSIVEKEDKIIKSKNDLKIGDEIKITLADGNIKAQVGDIYEGK